jgi:hypothetical protein
MQYRKITKSLAPKIEHKFADQQLSGVEADGTFSGYASLFDVEDLGNEVIAKGAFSKSLRDKKTSDIRLLFQHNPDEPIGHWLEIFEDTTGLFVKGRLNLNVARAREVHALMREGAIDGLSIGFKTVRARHEKSGKVRRILEADLWEVSVVTFPMLPQARVSQIKARGNLPTRRTFERWLVRDAGLSRSQAKTVITKGFSALASARDAAGLNHKYDETDTALLADKIRLAASRFK